jgi:ABC-2 type transport system ATP-binding protein
MMFTLNSREKASFVQAPKGAATRVRAPSTLNPGQRAGEFGVTRRTTVRRLSPCWPQTASVRMPVLGFGLRAERGIRSFMPPIIEVHELRKEFRTFRRREGVLGALQNLFVREYLTVRAVDGVSFAIQPGEMVGYIGANGAGKSTTIKMLTGILVPTSGRVLAYGYVPYRDRRRYTKHVGVVFGQRTQLWWDIAVIESFKLLKEIYEIPEQDYRRRLGLFSEMLNLKEYLHTPVRKLSLGERMRCDLAASLLHNPPLLFLDEPTIGLDVVAKDRIREFLKEVNRTERTTVLLTTHDLSDIEELSQRILIIDKGHILFDGALAEMKKRLAKYNQVKFFLKDRSQMARLDEIHTDGISCEQIDELTCLLRFDREQHSSAEVIRQIVNTLEVRDLLVEEEPIEEIVKRIYLSGEVA